jgi:hypothetical protein
MDKKLIILISLGILMFWYFTELLSRLLIVVVLAGLIWWYYKKNFEGFLNTRPDIGPVGAAPFRGFFNEPSKFVNFCLTQKPRGNNGPYPIYYWWKYLFNKMQNQQYKDCDQYRCQNKEFNGYNAKPGFNLANGIYVDPTQNLQSVSDLNFGSDCGYYENPIEFCNRYPHYEMCPNNWITSKHPVRNQQRCDLQTPLSWQDNRELDIYG